MVVLLRSTGSAFIHASLPVLGDRRELGLGVCWAEPRLPQRRFLGALLKAQLKDLAVSDAAAEVFGADASYGTDFANGANTEAGLRRRGGSARC